MNIPRISTSSATENVRSLLFSKWYQKYGEKHNFLLWLLFLGGALEESDSILFNRILIFTFQGLLLLLNTGTLFSLLFHHGRSAGSLMMVSGWFYLICLVITIVLWYEMRKRRKVLSALLRALPDVSLFNQTLAKRLFLYFMSVMPLVSAVLEALTNPERQTTFPYNFINNPTTSLITSFVVESFRALIYTTWMNWIVLLHCLLCKRISKSIRILTKEIEDCLPKDFSISRQVDILRKETEIHGSLRLLQEVFSAPTLLICVSHFCSSIAALSQMIYANLSVCSFCQYFLYYINATGGLLALLWVAGELPMEAGSFEGAFRGKARQRFLLNAQGDEICIDKKLIGATEFVLSGCGIVYFRRSSILALSGTILTYSTLLISTNMKAKKIPSSGL